jgi:Putative lumazine-binding
MCLYRRARDYADDGCGARDMERDAIGDDYTDFDTLIKLDGTWQIIAKGFPMYEG